MRCGALAVQQSRGRHQADAGTNARDGDTALASAFQPRHDRRVALNNIVDAQSSRRNKNQIGLPDFTDRRVRLDLDSAIAVNRFPIR